MLENVRTGDQFERAVGQRRVFQRSGVDRSTVVIAGKRRKSPMRFDAFSLPAGGDGSSHERAGSGPDIQDAITFAQQVGEQGDAFAQAVRGVAPLPYGVEDAICNMRIIDAVFASQKSGAWETV